MEMNNGLDPRYQSSMPYQLPACPKTYKGAFIGFLIYTIIITIVLIIEAILVLRTKQWKEKYGCPCQALKDDKYE